MRLCFHLQSVIHILFIALSTRSMALAQAHTSHATRSRVSQGFSRARAQHFQAPLSVPCSLQHYNRTIFSFLCPSHPFSFPCTACTGTSTTGIVQHSSLSLLLICTHRYTQRSFRFVDFYLAFFLFMTPSLAATSTLSSHWRSSRTSTHASGTSCRHPRALPH